MTARKVLGVAALAVIGVGIACSGAALAGGDPVAGQRKSEPCLACHGERGVAVDAMYPNLAGQYASYLEKALKDYRDGSRSNPLMSGFATNLSDPDIEDLAAWFASQEGLEVLSGD